MLGKNKYHWKQKTRSDDPYSIKLYSVNLWEARWNKVICSLMKDLLKWTGNSIPDFWHHKIKSQPTANMTALFVRVHKGKDTMYIYTINSIMNILHYFCKYRHTSFYWALQRVFFVFLQIEGLWQPCIVRGCLALLAIKHFKLRYVHFFFLRHNGIVHLIDHSIG